MRLRGFALSLSIAAVWVASATAAGVDPTAPTPARDTTEIRRGVSSAAARATASRTSSRKTRIRRYCRKVTRRRARTRRFASRREASKYKRLCRRRGARSPTTGTPAPGPLSAPTPIRPGARPEHVAPSGRYVSVQAREFSFTLSRPLVAAGDITIELRNSGEDPHNLIVSPQGTHERLVSFDDHDPAAVSAANLTLAAGGY